MKLTDLSELSVTEVLTEHGGRSYPERKHPIPEPLIPKPLILRPKPEVLSPMPSTLYPRPQTLSPMYPKPNFIDVWLAKL